MKQPVKAIIFDMCGVLLFKKIGYVPVSVDEVNALNIEKLYNHLDDQKLLADVKSELHLTDAQICKAIPYIPAKFEPFQDLWNILPDLKQQFKLAIINNGNAIARKDWDKLFDFSLFDLFINSAVVKIKKPDKSIFLLTCTQLGVEPRECLFIDDAKENVDSAKKLGMKTLWWNKENGKEKNLQSLVKFIGDYREEL